MDRTSLLDPMAASTHYLRGQILFTGFGGLAAAFYRRGLVVPAYRLLAMKLFFEGKLAAAIQTAQKSVALEPQARVRARPVSLHLHLVDLDAVRDVQRGFKPNASNGRFEAALVCNRAGNDEAILALVAMARKSN